MTAFLSSNPAKKIQHLLFYLLVFFLPTQLGKHFWPDFSLVHGIRIDYLSPTLFFTDILCVLFIFISFVKEKLVQIPRTSLLFFPFLLFGTLLSQSPLLSLYGVLKLTEYILFAFYASRLLAKQPVLQSALLVFSISMSIESVLAMLQFTQQQSLNGFWYFLGERTFTSLTPGIANASVAGSLMLRPYGTFPHPNVLAGYVLCGGILLFSHFRLFSKKQKMIVFISGMLSCIAFLLALSRSAFLAGFIVCLFLIIRRFKTVFPFIIVGGLLVILGFPFAITRITQTTLNEQAVVERAALFRGALPMIANHLFFGVGLLQTVPSLQNNLRQPVHMVPVLFLLETGIFFTAGVCFFLVKTIRHALCFSSQDFVISISIIWTVLSLTDHYFYTLQQGQLLTAFLFALLWRTSSSHT